MNLYGIGAIVLATVLAGTGVVKCSYDAGSDRQKIELGKVITAKDKELSSCLTAKADAEDMVEQKKREIDGLEDAAEAREIEVAEERRKAQGQITFFRKRAAELAQAKPSSPDMCAAAQSLIVKTLTEERQ